MAMIFLGGSRDIYELPPLAIERIGSIVTQELGVLIGDAPGADAEMQGLLTGYNYEHVGVFCAGDIPRNNLGDWAVYPVLPPVGAKGFATHAAKDREMARRADYGLMVWDGASPGTCLNVLRLAIANKPCVIYDLSRGSVATAYSEIDWRAMLHQAGPDVRRQVEVRMTPEEPAGIAGTIPPTSDPLPPPSAVKGRPVRDRPLETHRRSARKMTCRAGLRCGGTEG